MARSLSVPLYVFMGFEGAKLLALCANLPGMVNFV